MTPLTSAYEWITGLLTEQALGMTVHPTPNTARPVIGPAVIIDMPRIASDGPYNPVASQFTAAYEVLVLAGGQTANDLIVLYANTDRVIMLLAAASVRLSPLVRTNWPGGDTQPPLPAYRIPFMVTLRQTQEI